MIYNLLVFILFLSPLVFFHELGHFLFARLAGVRVEIFSIGFGKKLFSFKKGETEYRFSLIPLGGFVKMFGDDPLRRDEVAEDQRQFAYNHKSKWARFWIIFGGPLANFILSFFLYFFLVFKGEVVPLFKVGEIVEGSQLETIGLQTGDIISQVNGADIYSPEDFMILDASNDNTFLIIRNGVETELKTKVGAEEFLKSFYNQTKGLVEAKVIDRNGNQFELLPENKFSYQELANNSQQKIQLNGVEIPFSDPLTLKENLYKNGYFRHDLKVKKVIDGSPAAKAGVQENDVVVAVNDKPIYDFYDLRNDIQDNKSKPAKLSVYRNGELTSLTIKAEEKKSGEQIFYSIGVESSIQLFDPGKKEIAGKTLLDSLQTGAKRNWQSLVITFNGFKKIFLAEMSLESIGGPITIASVASNSLSIGLEQFLRLMALISINLGIINLFPIPVLDGGHIMFLFFELINRGPLSRKKMEIAQQFGISVLLLLITVALFNDFSRLFN